MQGKWQKLEELLNSMLQDGIFPGAVAAVHDEKGEVFSWTGGFRETEPRRLPMEKNTLFDLASLTKVVGVTMGAARLHEAGVLDYQAAIGDFIGEAGNFGSTTIKQLLTHSGGFIAEARLWNYVDAPADALSFILKGKPEYESGTRTIYSCFGFIVLGEIIGRICGKSLDTALAELVFKPLCMGETGFRPLDFFPERPDGFAATEYDEKTELMLSGTVHDENARFLGGIAGNAGLFSSASDLGLWMHMLISGGLSVEGKRFLQAETVASFYTDFTAGKGEDRGIGFKLYPRPAGAGGASMAFGHTGFTGTSMMVDPERKAGVLLLTNRVHPSREEKRLLEARNEFNETAFSCFDGRE